MKKSKFTKDIETKLALIAPDVRNQKFTAEHFLKGNGKKQVSLDFLI